MATNIQQFMNDMGIDSYEDIGYLYQDYIFECNEITMEINQLIDSSSPQVIEKLIHNLKGVSANLYVQSVYELAAELNHSLLIHIDEPLPTSEILSKWQVLHDEYSKATVDIITFFSRNNVLLKPKA